MRLTATTIVMATALAGCSSPGSITQLETTRTVPTANALIFPPPGGPAVVAVVERQYGNGVEQDIALRTQSSVSGQNSIKVKFIGPDTAGTETGKSLSSANLTDISISREMRREFPGVALAMSPSYYQNSYGPFGYAVGRTRGGETCVYGWQQIRSRVSARSALSNLGVIQIRLRLCDALRNEQSLVAIMYGYTINGSFTGWQWNPYGFSEGADPKLGAPGHPVYPAAAAIEHYAAPLGYEPPPVMRRAAAPQSRPRPVAARRTAPAPAAQTMMVPTGPRVPLPPVSAASTTSAPLSGENQTSTRSGSIRVPTPDCTGSGGACP